jgi:hypothetical protein
MSNISVYDNNQFAYRKASRNQTLSAAPRKLKRHLPLWLNIILILIVVAVAGAVGYVLTHPSVHRSPDAVANNFAQQVGNADYIGASYDIDPANKAAALAAMSQPGGELGSLVDGVFGTTHSTQIGTSTESGSTASVIVKACNQDLACNELPAIPCTRVNGKWYVDWTLLIQSLGTQQ